MKRRWYHRYYVVEVVPEHRVGGIMIHASRNRIEWAWSRRRAEKIARWFNGVRSPWEVELGLECVVELA